MFLFNFVPIQSYERKDGNNIGENYCRQNSNKLGTQF